MLTVIDVIRALSIHIDETYQRYPVQNRDIDDSVERPCSFIDVDDISSEMYAVKYIKDTNTISIYFFEENIEYGFLNLLKIKNEVMSWLSSQIQLDSGDWITPNNISAEVFKADKVIKITFDVDLIQEIIDNSEYKLDTMEELNYKEV